MANHTQVLHEMLGKTVHIVVDRPIGYRHGSLVYPVNYGYIPGLIAGDGEEQDVYILGIDQPVSSFDGRIVGAIRRQNDCEDKLIAAPIDQIFHQGEIAQAVHFQEQYFDYTIDSLFRKSCGVLPYRCKNGAREYLIVFGQFSQCWSLPKGHMEAGETESETALRELFEETGLTARLNTTIQASIEYPVCGICRKQVVFFPGEVDGEPAVRPGEIESYRWIQYDQLQDFLFPDTVEACKKLIRKMEEPL